MPCRIPMSAEAEYRGVQAPFDFTTDEGEKVNVPARLKFEVELPDGDVATLPISQSQLDRATPPFDTSKLKRGDHVLLELLVVWKGGEPKGESYVRLLACRAVEAAALKAA